MSQALPTTLERGHRLPPALAPARWLSRSLAGNLALAGLVATGFLIAAGIAAEPTSFVPARKGGFPAWLEGPLARLDIGIEPARVVLLIGAMWIFYLLALAVSDAISPRRAIGAIVALHVVFLLGPPLLSTDVFNYIEYGRLGVLHGLNPYTHAPASVPSDPAFPFIGWRDAISVYGPVFTLGTYATAPLGVGGALWALKAVAVGASLGCVALVWKGARLRGRSPVEAAMFFGLNPLLLVYAVGGAHNDLLMMLLALAGVVYVLSGREAAAGLAAVGGAAVKASSGLLLPFMLIGARARWRAVLAGAIAGAGVTLALGLAVFHGHELDIFDTLRWEQHHGSLHSVPKALGSLFGFGVGSPTLRLVTTAGFLAALALTLEWAPRGGDWIVAAGWATVALLVTTSWLLPWYVIWAMPLAAISGDRKLRLATFALAAFVFAMRVPLWLGWT